MVMLSLLLLGPFGTLGSARSLAFNCFVASTICFVIYYVTSVNTNYVTNGTLLLRGGGGLEDEQGDMEIDQYRTQNSSTDAFAEIAWIMSFGGSGTSYTITNVEHITGTTTATNYASDISPNVPAQFNASGGPFLHRPGDLVPKYILTKTHCGGYCMDCGVANYLDLSLLTFEAECRTGHAWGGEVVSYDHSVAVAKAVHLIRDPFDNIVGRMHLGSAHQQSRGEAGFIHSQQGLEDWCSYLDEKYQDQDESSHALDMDLPCRAEWYRYIQWHNLAAEVTEKIPHVLHMYYDNYTTNYDGTVTQLLDFLELEARNEPLFFQANKTYLEYFSIFHRQQAARFAQRFATEKSWKLLAHYFEPYLTTESTSQRERPLDDDDQVATIDSGTKNEIVAGSEGGEVALNFTYNERSEVVWLMSFPNSGTSYTLMNTAKQSQRSTATNYAEDLETCLPVRPELRDGPFLHELNFPLAKKTLTKTHCGGFCTQCPPHSYVHTLDSFQTACLSGHMNDEGRVRDVTYHPNVPSSAVHLIRNPFDNLVARMHLAIKKRRQDIGWDNANFDAFDNSPEGIEAWCQLVDGLYPDQEKSSTLIPKDVKRAWKDLPCHSEWFRWVQWHNRALEVTDRFHALRPGGFPVLRLYYEDYSTNYNATVEALFNFLDLEVQGRPVAFIPGKTYLSYFSLKHQEKAAQFVKSMGTPECWDMVKHYFDGMRH